MTKDSDDSTSPSQRGMVAALLDKIGARILGIALIAGLVLLGATTAYAVLSGRSVDFWGLRIGEGASSTKKGAGEAAAGKPACEEEVVRLQKRAEEAERRLGAAITRGDIPALWPVGKAKSDVLPILLNANSSSAECDDDDTFDCLYAKIENHIGKEGGFIDVRHTSQDVVKMVQKALQSIDAFDGNIDGDGTTAWSALLKFQRSKGIRSNDDVYEGKFGIKTLSKIRNIHKKIVDGA
jgi:hypothetical protein